MSGVRRVVVVGGGSNVATAATYVADALRAAGEPFELLGVLDDGRPDVERLAALGLRHLGPVADAGRCGANAYVLGAGRVEARRALLASVGDTLEPCTVLHPAARVSPGVAPGLGSVVQPFALIGPGADLGHHVHVSLGVVIGAGSRVGSLVSLFARSVVGDGATLGPGALIGTRAVVADGVTVGAGASVGAGAVVLDDVEAGVTVAGNPAHVVRRPG